MLKKIFDEGNFDIQSEVAWTASNIFKCGTDDQISQLKTKHMTPSDIEQIAEFFEVMYKLISHN